MTGSPEIKHQTCLEHPFLPQSQLNCCLSVGTSTLGKDFITYKLPALLEPVSPHYFQGGKQLLAEGKQRVKDIRPQAQQAGPVLLRQRGAEAECSKLSLN